MTWCKLRDRMTGQISKIFVNKITILSPFSFKISLFCDSSNWFYFLGMTTGSFGMVRLASIDMIDKDWSGSVIQYKLRDTMMDILFYFHNIQFGIIFSLLFFVLFQ